jgi:nucleotide-binding universal stress UspA family protein
VDRDETEDEVHDVFEMARRVAARYERDVTTATAEGDPSRGILEWIDENDVGHVVIGCHGRDGVARWLLGSVAETVVRRAPVPVTAVK